MEIHEDATEAAVEVKRKAATGAIGFDFDSLYDQTEEPLPAKVPDRPEWTKKDKLAFEREMLGLYVSDHPLAGTRDRRSPSTRRSASMICSPRKT